MLFDLFLDWVSGLMDWFWGGVEIPTLPSYVTEGASSIGGVLALGRNLCNWIPMDEFATAVTLVMGAWLLGFTLKIWRIVFGMVRGSGM